MQVAALGMGRMLRSQDGGKTFAASDLPEKSTCFAGAFRGNELLVFSDQGRGFLIHPSGTTEPLTLPASATWDGASFRDTQHGAVIGTQSTLLVTSDGGATWTKRTAPDGGQAVAFLGTALFATGEQGISRSDDDGVTFTNVLHPRMGCVRMEARDGILAAACKSDPPDFSNSFAYSTDGKTFRRSTSSNLPFAMSVAIEPGGHLAGVGANPVLLEGPLEKMEIVYESRLAQGQRIATTTPGDDAIFPSVMKNRGSNLPATVPLTMAQQEAFLAQPLTPISATSFNEVAEQTYDATKVDLSLTGPSASFHGTKPCTKPTSTWRQCFDELAALTGKEWRYDSTYAAWRFEPLTKFPSKKNRKQ
jgi:hypothetical protein